MPSCEDNRGRRSSIRKVRQVLIVAHSQPLYSRTPMAMRGPNGVACSIFIYRVTGLQGLDGRRR